MKMGEWLAMIVVAGLVAWAIWSVIQPRYLFEIRVDEGQPRVRKGKVTAAFLKRVRAVCQESSVSHGWIRGLRLGRRVALRFSRHFPPGPQQQLRNEWQVR